MSGQGRVNLNPPTALQEPEEDAAKLIRRLDEGSPVLSPDMSGEGRGNPNPPTALQQPGEVPAAEELRGVDKGSPGKRSNVSEERWVNLDTAFSVSKTALTDASPTEGITGEEEENPLAMVVYEGEPFRGDGELPLPPAPVSVVTASPSGPHSLPLLQLLNEVSAEQEEKAPTIEEIWNESMSRADPPPGPMSTEKTGFAAFLKGVQPLASRGFESTTLSSTSPIPDAGDTSVAGGSCEGPQNLDPPKQAGLSVTHPNKLNVCLPNLDVRSNLEGRHVGDVGYTYTERITDYFVRRDMLLGGRLKHCRGDRISKFEARDIMDKKLYSYREGDLEPVKVDVERKEDIEEKSVDIQKELGSVVIDEFGSNLHSREEKILLSFC